MPVYIYQPEHLWNVFPFTCVCCRYVHMYLTCWGTIGSGSCTCTRVFCVCVHLLQFVHVQIMTIRLGVVLNTLFLRVRVDD